MAAPTHEAAADEQAATRPPALPSIPPGCIVVMLVANPFTHDTRVERFGRCLRDTGTTVHVVAAAGTDLPATEIRDGLEIVRVPWPRRSARPLLWLPLVLLGHGRPGRLRRLLPREAGPPASRSSPATATHPGAWARTAGRLSGPSVQRLDLNRHFAAAALRLEPDLVIAHDLDTLLAGVIVKRLGGARLLYDSHELFLERNIGTKSRRLDRMLWGPVERTGIRQCDAVTTVASGISEHLARRYGIDPPRVIRNVPSRLESAARPDGLAARVGVAADVPLVLYAGAIIPGRGLEDIIDSAPHLHHGAYVLMGDAPDGAYLESLRRRAQERDATGTRVHFTPAAPPEQVPGFTAGATLCVVPTRGVCLSYRFEASNKIFQAIAAGVPLVMTDHPEKRRLVEEHGVGVLCGEADPEDLARAVNELLEDGPRREVVAARCREAAAVLNWETESQVLLEAVAPLLASPASAGS